MDQDYAFYVLLENRKNKLYRQLSNARHGFTKFYYSWFYTDEKLKYNVLNMRQKLGREILPTEFDEYNKIRVITINSESNGAIFTICPQEKDHQISKKK